MKELSLKKRFDLYINTLKECGIFLLSLSDEEIEYYIFEEFDIGVVSYLYKDNLLIFIEAGLINNKIYFKSQVLRKKLMALHNTELWNIESVKNTEEWKIILRLSDETKKLIHEKWSGEELKYLSTENIREISLEKRFDLYMDILMGCGIGVLSLSDELIEYHILQKLSIGINQCLHKDKIHTFVDNGFINDEIFDKTQILSEKIIGLENTSLWNINSIRSAFEWKEVLELSNEIKLLIRQLWSDEDMRYLRGN